MITGNKRRTIVVGGNEYEYAVTGRWGWGKSVFIKNLSTKKTCSKYYDFEREVKPFDVCQIILDEGV